MPISRGQMPRQMYGLGSLVKSIGKTVKKVVGSPLGKAAILGFGANALMPGGLSSLFSGGGGLASMFGKAKSFIGGLSGMQKAAGAAGILGLGGAFGGMEDQQVEELKSNPEALANYLRSYYSRLNKTASPQEVENFVQRNMQANGGRIMRAFGSDELVEQASGIEGLDININPQGVKELDLRDSGGFIPPVGVKEKADDIPAMLSNNEFVMTADAVREFGDGNVNKGAQRMYDMMKKLENGGKV